MKTYLLHYASIYSDKMHRSRFNIIINYHVWTINPFFSIIWERFPLFSEQYRWIDWKLIEIHRDWQFSRRETVVLFAFAQQIISDFYSTSAFAVAMAVTYAVESFRSNPFDRSKIIWSLPYYSGTAELKF